MGLALLRFGMLLWKKKCDIMRLIDCSRRDISSIAAITIMVFRGLRGCSVLQIRGHQTNKRIFLWMECWVFYESFVCRRCIVVPNPKQCAFQYYSSGPLAPISSQT